VGDRALGIRTQSIHGGTVPDPVTGAIGPVISPSLNFAARFGEIGLSAVATSGDASSFVYSREGHPTARMLETRLALLEGGDDALVFGTGMAAIATLLLQFLDVGDHLVVSDSSYAGTAELVRDLLPRKGIAVSAVDSANLGEVEAAIRSTTRLVLVESPSNPLTKLVDISALAELTHRAGTRLVVDSTLATPIATRPLEHGADLVVHSASKYLGGHGDALGGAIVGDAEMISRLRGNLAIRLGGALSPFDAWLLLRGIETLDLRMQAHTVSATLIAAELEQHPFVVRVLYPGLPSHPQHELATRQMQLAGGLIAFSVRDPLSFGQALNEHGSLVSYATSLGLTRSVILYCDTAELQRTTYRLDDLHLGRYRSWAGDGVFRLSVGLEDPRDLIDEMGNLLRAASASLPAIR